MFHTNIPMKTKKLDRRGMLLHEMAASKARGSPKGEKLKSIWPGFTWIFKYLLSSHKSYIAMWLNQ